MAGSKRHTDSRLPAVSKRRLVAGVALGLLFAFSFYSFLYMIREVIRVLFFTSEEYDVMILTDSEVGFKCHILELTKEME